MDSGLDIVQAIDLTLHNHAMVDTNPTLGSAIGTDPAPDTIPAMDPALNTGPILDTNRARDAAHDTNPAMDSGLDIIPTMDPVLDTNPTRNAAHDHHQPWIPLSITMQWGDTNPAVDSAPIQLLTPFQPWAQPSIPIQC
ncbi:Hypothetical protein NTJ_07727 [Nesidiocoris tenuis]|nr:Hypothetical protein NTJ_07727 [Nesidiocoris tenuis]